MDELIHRLDTWLAKNRPDFYAALQPGLTEEELSALEDALNVTLPEDFRAFYRWRNGQPTDSYEALADRYSLLCDRDILSAWQFQKQMLEEGHLDTEGLWDVRWVPFVVDSGGADFDCLDLAGAFGGPPGQIVHFQHDDYERGTTASSLRKWLEVLVTAFETGIIASVEEEEEDYEEGEEIPTEYAVVDQETFAALRERLDPGYLKFANARAMDMILSHLETWLRRNRPDYLAALLPGLTEEKLTQLEEALGFPLPSDLKELYRWRGGSRDGRSDRLAFSMTWLNADALLREWQEMQEAREAWEDSDSVERIGWNVRWNIRWVPFLANGSGDYLCVDTLGAFGGLPGQVLHFGHESHENEARPILQASNLRLWLEVLVTALEQNLLSGESEWVVVDEDAFADLQSRQDPGYPREA